MTRKHYRAVKREIDSRIYYLDMQDMIEDDVREFLEGEIDMAHVSTRSYLSTRINEDVRELGRGVGFNLVFSMFNTLLMIILLLTIATIYTKMNDHDNELYKRILEVRQFTRDLQNSVVHCVIDENGDMTINMERNDTDGQKTLQSGEEGN